MFLSPSSVAIVGASAEEGKAGNIVLETLMESYRGKIYPVNPKYDDIFGMRCYGSLADIGEKVDLAIVVVPAKAVREVIRDAGKAGIKGLIVVSGGFSEIGRRDLEREMVEEAKRWKIKILGPNTMGVLNLHNGFNTFFTPRLKRMSDGEVSDTYIVPEKGNVAIITQSGGLGTTVMDRLSMAGIGVRCFVGTGNQADLEVSDFIEYFAEDPNTGVILLYLEGVKDGRRFIETAWKASRKKPIVAIRAGKTKAGRRAAMTHTASMITNKEVYDAALKRAGIIEAETVEDAVYMIETLLSLEPIEKDELFILSNGGGGGVVAADFCEMFGFKLNQPEGTFLEELRDAISKGRLPPIVTPANPLDLTGSATDEHYSFALDLISKHSGASSILSIVFFIGPAMTDELVKIFERARSQIPIVTCIVGEAGYERKVRALLKNLKIPCYSTPEAAAMGLMALRLRAECLKISRPLPLKSGGENRVKWLNEHKKYRVLVEPYSYKLLSEYGILYPNSVVARNIDEVEDALKEINEPFAMKAVSYSLLHKTDSGGVILNLKREKAKEAYRRISSHVKDLNGILIQEMVSGMEVLISGFRDPIFGPVVNVASGGIYTEILKDYVIDFAPLSKHHALSMLNKLKIYPILEGYRGGKRYDVEALADVLVKVSDIMVENPLINEIELNPIIVKEKGAYAVDVKVLLEGSTINSSQ